MSVKHPVKIDFNRRKIKVKRKLKRKTSPISRIVVKDGRSSANTNVFIDGTKIHGIQNIEFSTELDGISVVTFTIAGELVWKPKKKRVRK